MLSFCPMTARAQHSTTCCRREDTGQEDAQIITGPADAGGTAPPGPISGAVYSVGLAISNGGDDEGLDDDHGKDSDDHGHDKNDHE